MLLGQGAFSPATMAQSFGGAPGFGAWACDGVPQASHVAAMTAPALLNKTITHNSAWGPNRFFRPGRLARLGAADSLWPGAPDFIE
jgi:hypothetical protein